MALLLVKPVHALACDVKGLLVGLGLPLYVLGEAKKYIDGSQMRRSDQRGDRSRGNRPEQYHGRKISMGKDGLHRCFENDR